MKLDNFIKEIYRVLPALAGYLQPWEITAGADRIVGTLLSNLSDDEYDIEGTVAIHKTATIENNVTIKGSAIIGRRCFVGAGAYLRGGTYLADDVSIGPGCEIKSSFIFMKSRLAHFNFVGDSIVGEDVNFEAGAVTANYFNESEKEIRLLLDGEVVKTGVRKFGALVGDNARIGANAVLDPGSVLVPGRVIGRLEHYDQFKGTP